MLSMLRHSWLPAVALLTLGLVASCTSHDPAPCTLLGCADSIDVGMINEWDIVVERYSARLTFPTGEVELGCEYGHTVSLRVAGPLQAHCSSTGEVRVAPTDGHLPADIRANAWTQTRAGGYEGPLRYELSSPNGLGCEPHCWHASITVQLLLE